MPKRKSGLSLPKPVTAWAASGHGVQRAADMDALKERMLVLKNKIANYKTRLLRTEEKSEAICEAIFEIFKVR